MSDQVLEGLQLIGVDVLTSLPVGDPQGLAADVGQWFLPVYEDEHGERFVLVVSDGTTFGVPHQPQAIGPSAVAAGGAGFVLLDQGGSEAAPLVAALAEQGAGLGGAGSTGGSGSSLDGFGGNIAATAMGGLLAKLAGGGSVASGGLLSLAQPTGGAGLGASLGSALGGAALGQAMALANAGVMEALFGQDGPDDPGEVAAALAAKEALGRLQSQLKAQVASALFDGPSPTGLNEQLGSFFGGATSSAAQPASVVGDADPKGNAVTVGAGAVLIGGQPAAREGDPVAATGVVVSSGSATVLTEGASQATIGASVSAEGPLSPGVPTVLIGGAPGGTAGGPSAGGANSSSSSSSTSSSKPSGSSGGAPARADGSASDSDLYGAESEARPGEDAAGGQGVLEDVDTDGSDASESQPPAPPAIDDPPLEEPSTAVDLAGKASGSGSSALDAVAQNEADLAQAGAKQQAKAHAGQLEGEYLDAQAEADKATVQAQEAKGKAQADAYQASNAAEHAEAQASSKAAHEADVDALQKQSAASSKQAEWEQAAKHADEMPTKAPKLPPSTASKVLKNAGLLGDAYVLSVEGPQIYEKFEKGCYDSALQQSAGLTGDVGGGLLGGAGGVALGTLVCPALTLSTGVGGLICFGLLGVGGSVGGSLGGREVAEGAASQVTGLEGKGGACP